MFKGRTVTLLVLAAMVAGSLLTVTFTGQWSLADSGQLSSGLFADIGNSQSRSDMKKIETTIELVTKNYVEEVERSKLVDGAINGIMNALEDPFSSYMGESTAQQFSEQIEGSFSGIGAEVSMENGNVVVVSPIKGSPAEKAGIQPKDILLSVNGESFEGLTLNEAVSKIRGPKGTEAKIKVKRAGSTEPLEFSIIRDDIALETIYARMEDDRVGVIEITEFSNTTAERFAKELEGLEKQGMKGLVIDVRNNPGGVLPVVIEMAEQFVPKGKAIVQVEDKQGRRDSTVSKGSGKNYPVVVITNKGSASASEILAGALKESAGAKIVGEATYGKGTVQSTYSREMGDGSMLKITIAKWLTPSGKWIHKEGIQPDVQVSQPEYFMVAPINKDKTYKYDMLGEDVRNAQIMLEGLGFKLDRRDGYFSKETENALKKFQKSQGLEANGILNGETAEKLETSLIEAIRDPQNDMQMKRALEEIRKEIAKVVSNK